MNRQLKNIIERLPILLAVIIIITCVSCGNQSQRYPTLGSTNESGDYLIDPDTILNMLDQGNTNVFTSMVITPGPDDDLLSPGSVTWIQSDYLKIASALSSHVWADEMAGWSIYSISFNRDCHNAIDGFDSFVAIYFKEVTIKSERKYTTRQIDIFPLAKQVTWGDGSEYPHPFLGSWNAVDMKNFEITADEALQIAEANGGKDARSKVDNECNILVNSPHNDTNKWSVSYYVLASFQVIIDPYNGKFKTFTKFQ